MKRFKDYEREKAKWVTSFETKFYPDGLEDAKRAYGPVLERFGELLGEAKDSADLLRRIASDPLPGRTQLQRVFRRYVSTVTPVEMLKKITLVEDIIRDFGSGFRPIEEVRAHFKRRPKDDETLAALLLEQADRGKKGYELTGVFFEWFELEFEREFTIEGPKGAGRDVMLNEALPGYKKATPADFVVRDQKTGKVVAVGFGRYDSDRGGSQEDDRTSSNSDKITDVFEYNKRTGNKVKIVFLNDGPGLCLGSMWRDYVSIEERDPSRVVVLTLKMLKDRLTREWLRG